MEKVVYIFLSLFYSYLVVLATFYGSLKYEFVIKRRILLFLLFLFFILWAIINFYDIGISQTLGISIILGVVIILMLTYGLVYLLFLMDFLRRYKKDYSKYTVYYTFEGYNDNINVIKDIIFLVKNESNDIIHLLSLIEYLINSKQFYLLFILLRKIYTESKNRGKELSNKKFLLTLSEYVISKLVKNDLGFYINDFFHIISLYFDRLEDRGVLDCDFLEDFIKSLWLNNENAVKYFIKWLKDNYDKQVLELCNLSFHLFQCKEKSGKNEKFLEI